MIRLFVNINLDKENLVALDEKQTHYLFHVMKTAVGEKILCFDNQSGEFEFAIKEISKKNCLIEKLKQTKSFVKSSDLWLLFAPLKKDNTDFVVEKATELGVDKIIPVITMRTNSEKTRTDRMKLQVIEAAEQCRRVDLPGIEDAVKLQKILEKWDAERVLFFMDESLNGKAIMTAFKDINSPKAAILVGPEGGFSDEEFAILRKMPFAKAVTMGQRIMRAETAAIASVACWQAINGDWK